MSKATFKVSIVLAEDIRAEHNGKFTIVGTWPYTVPVYKSDLEAHGTTNLAAYAEVETTKQPSKVQVRVEKEDGSNIAEAVFPAPPPETVTRGFVVGGRFQNLPFPSEGKYYVVVVVDDHIAKREFEIKFEKI